ncbi:hypothetical protein QE152_g14454 [Popillia japonica]|uniref:Uncharacterized protein n=1 Tax=Popillia japonica TaxID=7064 RepID=A0AAW1L6U5_POPJA
MQPQLAVKIPYENLNSENNGMKQSIALVYKHFSISTYKHTYTVRYLSHYLTHYVLKFKLIGLFHTASSILPNLSIINLIVYDMLGSVS